MQDNVIPNPDYNYPKLLSDLSAQEKEEMADKIFDKYGLFCHNDITQIVYNSGVLPVDCCGGNMSFGRVFAINHLAFPSPEAIVGFRNAEHPLPLTDFKISKGLKFVGTLRNWVLFKLDPTATDDHSGMLYSTLEKNFTVEFAHFPHEGDRRILYRWEDS